MKFFIRLTLVLAALAAGVIAFASCTDDWEETFLSVGQTSFDVPSGGETLTVPINTNSSWRVVSPTSWCSFDKTSGNGDDELNITVSRNSSNKRSGEVNICAGTEFQTIEIEQAGSTSGTLSVTTGSCTITRVKSGSSYKYTIKAIYTVRGGHLASEAGVMMGNRTAKNTGTISDGQHTATFVVATSSSSYTVSYKAYAKRKSDGKYVYGTTQTKRY